jgi:hypothetical protein
MVVAAGENNPKSVMDSLGTFVPAKSARADAEKIAAHAITQNIKFQAGL